METLLQDLKYALRTLAHSPGFTAVAILSLALGIGANTAIFTLTDAVFLNPLPVQEAARVLQVYCVDHATVTTAANLTRTPMSFLNYQDLRDQNNVFAGFSAYTGAGVTLTGYGEPKPEFAILTSANYFDVLGVKPALGRLFFPDEDQKPGADTVVVLSYSLWTKQFGADPGIIGRSINLSSMAYTVIGVAPPGFKGTLTVSPPDLVWIPISMHAQALPGPVEAFFGNRRFRFISTFGRLKPGVDPAQALAALKTIAGRLEQQYPESNRGRSIETSSLADAALGFLPRDQMVVAGIALSSVVGLVLLIASVNLANLLLARSSKRSREMGIRTALGAERGRLVRQLLTESLLLSIGGGAVGLLIGSFGCQLLWSFRPTFLQQNSIALHMDARVFAFAAGVTLLTGLLFGLAPALRASAPDVGEVLKTRGVTEAWGRSPLRSALVVSEVALALVALISAGLFVRSMQNVQRTDLGFESHNLFSFNFDLASRHYTPDRARQFFRSMQERALATPGVQNVALASSAPLNGGILLTVFLEGQQTSPDQRGTLTLINVVSPAYWDTMHIPLREGRWFTDFDRADSAKVAVITQAAAQHFWPGQIAIGKRFRFSSDNALREVVGVVANSVTTTIGEQPQPVIYLPVEQQFNTSLALVVRTGANPDTILPAVRARVQSLDNDLALTNASTIQRTMAQGLWAPRMAAALFGVFGLLGMLLASIGIYGVMAYMVSQRTNEIGIRMALGARPADVLQLVVGQGMRLALAGIVIGVLAALALTRLMASLLFAVRPYDPVTFVVVSAILSAVALLAGWLPARRAARIDPLVALRQE
ncbi:MAG TPA: ABC transporter permease [Bryobacteraceae bacterium]|nr:ABC transporter permease [Bryobacteraceae bacterium]